MNNKYDQFLTTSYQEIGSMPLHSHSNSHLRVAFQLGNTCTNDCSYCPGHTKNGSVPWPEIDKVEKIIKKINEVYRNPPYNKTHIQFELSGGEVTVWPKIERVLEILHEHNNSVHLVTNGVRSLRWWAEYGKYFEHLVISFHPEFASTEHTTEVLNILTDQGVRADALIMMLPSHWDVCLSAIEYMKNHGTFNNIWTRALNLIKPGKHEQWPYTEQELNWIQNNTNFRPLNSKEVLIQDGPGDTGSFWRNSTSGEYKLVEFESLAANRQNNWKNWQCYVGIDTLFLEQNGDVRRDAMCYVRPSLGNWKLDDIETIQWVTEPVRCPFDACFCSADSRARKIKN